MADFVEASLADAQKRLELLDLEVERAEKRAEIGQHSLLWVRAVVRETRRQTERSGEDSFVRDAPPPLPEDRGADPQAEGWSVDWGQVEDPSRLVYIYTPESSGWGYGPEYHRTERLIYDDETWGQALERIGAWAERWHDEHGLSNEEAVGKDRRLAALLLYKWNVLSDVINDFVRYGYVERRTDNSSKEDGGDEAQLSSAGSLLRWKRAFTDVLFEYDREKDFWKPRQEGTSYVWAEIKQSELFRRAERSWNAPVRTQNKQPGNSAKKAMHRADNEQRGGPWPAGDVERGWRELVNNWRLEKGFLEGTKCTPSATLRGDADGVT